MWWRMNKCDEEWSNNIHIGEEDVGDGLEYNDFCVFLFLYNFNLKAMLFFLTTTRDIFCYIVCQILYNDWLIF